MRPRQYILFNKPYGVLSQFRREAGWKSLADFGPFPVTVYPVGRLDVDSEGLLLLTDDNVVKHRLTDPRWNHRKTYLVQVEGIPGSAQVEMLSRGIHLGAERTMPAEAAMLDHAPDLPPRAVPIRYRRDIPTTWMSITVRQGRNRQVRRMTAAVGHPALRLVRVAMGPILLGELAPGEHRALDRIEIADLLASVVPQVPPKGGDRRSDLSRLAGSGEREVRRGKVLPFRPRRGKP